jgi:outer membrane biosynthesis protein TonB
MFHRAAMTPAAQLVLALSCLLAAGCAGVKHVQTPEPVPAAPPAASSPAAEAPATTAPEAEAAPAAAALPEARATPAPSPAIQPVPSTEPAPAARAAAPKAPAAVAPAATVTPPKPPPKPAAAVAMAPAPAKQVVPRVVASPATPQPSAAPLDLKSLETRLRQTTAIGVFTKLSLKNQVDDLLEKFRAYHKRQGAATLAELRRNYDMLLLKVLSLLQDSDPPLARDIVRSRAAIWGILEDPKKFTESNLMAGETS